MQPLLMGIFQTFVGLYSHCLGHYVFPDQPPSLFALVKEMYRFGITFGLALLCGRVFAAFGLEESNSTYKVDTDGGLIFEVDR